MNLYLIETVTNGGKTVLEYKMVEKKKDMRTKFCKENEDMIISPIALIRAISKYKVQVKDDRVIMQSGEIAYKFRKELKESELIGK